LKLVDGFTQAFELLSTNTELEERLEHSHLQLRQFVVEKYLVTYQITANQVTVVRVIHGAQLFDEIQ
jgi:plasmid stabilization system protein ParE